MKEITSSATRLTLLAVVITLCAAFALVTVANVDQAEIVNGVVSLFQNVAIAIVAFYFGQKAAPKEKAATEIRKDPEFPEAQETQA